MRVPPKNRWGYTLLGGGHFQERNDIDGDGWADLQAYKRGVFRPRLFWDDKQGRFFFATVGVTARSGMAAETSFLKSWALAGLTEEL